MLEIIAIIVLCQKNGQNAAIRGNNKIGTYVYTVLLWLGCELFAAIFTATVLDLVNADFGFLTYIGALLGALIGGWLSWFIASRGEPLPSSIGNLTAQEIDYLRVQGFLPTPCLIVVHREKSIVGSFVINSILLNGQVMAQVTNGKTVQFTTTNQRNVVSMNTNDGTRLSGSVVFDGLPGGRFEIFVTSNAIQTERTMVYPGAPVAAPPTAVPAPELAAPLLPPDPGSSSYCRHCGALRDTSGEFCPNCGARD